MCMPCWHSLRRYHFKEEHHQSLIWLRLESSSGYRAHALRLNYPSPLVAFLVFGTQRDILEAWSWRREEDSSETHDQEQDTGTTSFANEETGLPRP
ncbi:hypothetical protein BGY98DRAFT_1186733 [Russula aff. rugulosa BPL654]|nr:hypothetical protein BGY98DRAFT_1186733 [Russula aff. rugulosa BPL654]